MSVVIDVALNSRARVSGKGVGRTMTSARNRGCSEAKLRHLLSNSWCVAVNSARRREALERAIQLEFRIFNIIQAGVATKKHSDKATCGKVDVSSSRMELRNSRRSSSYNRGRLFIR